jgi:hypothetical protein
LAAIFLEQPLKSSIYERFTTVISVFDQGCGEDCPQQSSPYEWYASGIGQIMSNVVYLTNRRSCAAPDARADDGRRRVLIDQRCIRIDRSVAGVKMRLAVPVEGYRGVVLASEEAAGGQIYYVSLAHRDTEFSVDLLQSTDQADVLSAWQNWARYFSLPAILDEADAKEEELHAETFLRPRRRGDSLTKRRPRISKRRQQGRAGGPTNVVADAHKPV